MSDSPQLPFPDARKRQQCLGFRQHALRLLGILLLFLLLAWMIVATIKWLTVEELSREDIVAKTFSGRAQIQTMAAEEWLRSVIGHQDKQRYFPTMGEDQSLLEILGRAEEQDVLLLRALARLTAFAPWPAKKRQQFPELIAQYNSEILWPVRSLLLMSYAQAGFANEAEVRVVARDAGHQSATVRKTVAYLLGQKITAASQLSEAAVEALYRLYEDSDREVRVNALLALAQAGDPRGVQGTGYWLKEIIQNSDNNVKLSRNAVIYQAIIKVAARIESPDVRVLLEQIAYSHSDIRLRRLALDSLR